MSLETNIGNAVATFFTGVGLSLADRLYSENAKRFREERENRKLEQVKALSYLAETDSGISSEEYCHAIIKARDYFESRGIQRSKRVFRQAVDKIAHYSTSPELINNLKAGSKLALAAGIQITYDGFMLLTQVLTGRGHFGRAFAHSLYQVPAFFAGMWLTGKALDAKDKVIKSKNEKELDSMARELTADGKLLDIVRNYSPTAKLKEVESRVIEETEQQQLPERTQAAYSPLEKATDLGERVGTKIANTAEGVSKGVNAGIDVIRKRMQERKAARDAEEKNKADQLKSKYENY
jgi:hypothetical protein